MLYQDEIPLGNAKNLSGQKFGRLTPLYRIKDENNKGRATWKCLCDCGNYKNVKAEYLTKGKISSCGCLLKESRIKNGQKRKRDLQGQFFGELEVLEEMQERTANKNIIWKCRCSCGRETYVAEGNLTKKNGIKSCGKCNRSKGELTINQLLAKANISFVEEKTFETCRFPDTQYLAKFDFYVNNQYLIEYDGEQHFSYRGMYTKEKFDKIQLNDVYKNKWCIENNIPLIRIPYTHLNNLCLEDLLLSTSKFIIGDNYV